MDFLQPIVLYNYLFLFGKYYRLRHKKAMPLINTVVSRAYWQRLFAYMAMPEAGKIGRGDDEPSPVL
ncbi:MAG: hypothetical protein HY272_07065 [Gammaproteobacteria bacterium]|nr:hypothetical protein [Gammaproteobacteria bacterium]